MAGWSVRSTTCFSPVSQQANKILLCDYCDAGYHMQCLSQPLAAAPTGNWLCPRCVQAGVTAAEAQSAVVARHQKAQASGTAPNLHPNKQMRQRDEAAKELHGRLILQNFVDHSSGLLRPFWGRAHFMGEQSRPQYFNVHFEDGDVYPYTTAEVKKYLQPVGMRLPAGVTLPNDRGFEADELNSLSRPRGRHRQRDRLLALARVGGNTQHQQHSIGLRRVVAGMLLTLCCCMCCQCCAAGMSGSSLVEPEYLQGDDVLLLMKPTWLATDVEAEQQPSGSQQQQSKHTPVPSPSAHPASSTAKSAGGSELPARLQGRVCFTPDCFDTAAAAGLTASQIKFLKGSSFLPVFKASKRQFSEWNSNKAEALFDSYPQFAEYCDTLIEVALQCKEPGDCRLLGDHARQLCLCIKKNVTVRNSVLWRSYERMFNIRDGKYGKYSPFWFTGAHNLFCLLCGAHSHHTVWLH